MHVVVSEVTRCRNIMVCAASRQQQVNIRIADDLMAWSLDECRRRHLPAPKQRCTCCGRCSGESAPYAGTGKSGLEALARSRDDGRSRQHSHHVPNGAGDLTRACCRIGPGHNPNLAGLGT